MGKALKFSYYPPSDELNIHFDKPRPCISKEIGDEIYLRFDSKTYEIVGLTILNFRHRFGKAKGKILSFNLPVLAEVKLTKRKAKALGVV
jgi:hypothetical protein